jgi:hypothetical protein
VPEDGFTWTNGRRAEILIPRPSVCDYFLQLTHGVLRPDGQPWQRVSVSVDGHPIGHYVARNAEEHEFWIPEAIIAGSTDPLRLVFTLPDAFRPADDGHEDRRTLALAFKRLALNAVVHRKVVRTAANMESIGRNCEFGFVQAELGLDTISLLRWAGAETQNLIRAIDERFAGLAEETEGRPEPPGRPPDQQHWWLTCRRYGILFHTGEVVADFSVPEATARVRPRLRWLADKLLADLRAGDKTFVHCSGGFTDPRDGLPLAAAIRRAGGYGPLLLVAAGGHQPVTSLEHNVWGARLPRLTDMGNAASRDTAQWLRVIRELAECL